MILGKIKCTVYYYYKLTVYYCYKLTVEYKILGNLLALIVFK